MKTLIKFAVVPLFLLSACTTTNQLSSAYDDDGVYTSKKDKPAVLQSQKIDEKQSSTIAVPNPATYKEVKPESYNSNEQAVDKSQMSYDKYKQSQAENAYKATDTNSYEQSETENYQENQNYSDYNADDYYDYGYSSRLRRFHSPCRFSGYYDDYYTNMYWYNNDPFYYGTSIYLGYNWFGPSYSYYNPYYYNNWGYSFGFGLGWGYYGMGYYGWNSPYGIGGYYGYDYYGHGHGHGHGYNDDNWASNNYNNSSSSYFGPRNYIGASNGATTPRRSASDKSGLKSTPDQRISTFDNTSKRTDTKTPVNDISRTPITSDKQNNSDIRRNNDITPANAVVRTNDNKENTVTSTNERKADVLNNRDENQNNISRSYTSPTNQTNPNTRINNYQRYSRSTLEKQSDKPSTNTSPNTYNYRDPKSYSSPAYSQPRSSQEFESPKYKSERNYSTRPQTSPSNNQTAPRSNPNRNYNLPSNNSNRIYTPPANNQNRNYSSPSNNENRNYTPPANNEQRNYTQPSNNNYTAPAPSRSTYSPPSNSGGSNSRSSGGNSGSENQRRR